jgi:hypothetical protein
LGTGGNGTFSYQWYSNSSNTNTGGPSIVGQQSNSYTPPTNTVGTKYYYCVVSQNSTSGCSVTSAAAAIIVISAPQLHNLLQLCLPRRHLTTLSITVSGATGTSINGIQIILITQILVLQSQVKPILLILHRLQLWGQFLLLHHHVDFWRMF